MQGEVASEPLHGTKVAVVGAGSIGVGCAIVFAAAGATVTIHDVDSARLAAGVEKVRDRLGDFARFDLLVAEPDAIAARVAPAGELRAALEGAVHVQECAPESLELKRELFARLDAEAPPPTVL